MLKEKNKSLTAAYFPFLGMPVSGTKLIDGEEGRAARKTLGSNFRMFALFQRVELSAVKHTSRLSLLPL
jgi:hypothetical protein